MAGKKRRRNVPLYVWVSPEELQAIKDRMEQTGMTINCLSVVCVFFRMGIILEQLQNCLFFQNIRNKVLEVNFFSLLKIIRLLCCTLGRSRE